MAARQRLSRETWATAALDALVGGGVAAVAVEPLAAQLGTTKGSFYWHFTDRGELVRAALELWEREHTDGVIEHLSSIEGPAERLHVLLDLVITHVDETDPVVALMRDVAHPDVAAVVERVTRRRIGYVADQLVASGTPRAEARRRAAMAVAAYVGWWQLHSVVPDETPVGRRGSKHAEVLRLLVDAPLPRR